MFEFGYEENFYKIKVGDIVKNKFASPNVKCVAYMLGWNNDIAFEYDGGFAGQKVLIIEAIDYTTNVGKYKTGHDPRTDKDEVFIYEGIIKEILTPENFRDRYKVDINGIYHLYKDV